MNLAQSTNLNNPTTGKYVVAGTSYLNKILAFEKAFSNGWWPHWDYYEDKFSQYDWTKEPVQDLRSLYQQRAEQLRNHYDYLILWYSGGSDSHTVAMSFVNNNIHLDELWHRTVSNYIQRSDYDKDAGNLPNEYHYVVLPQTKELQLKNKDLKLQVFDPMRFSIDYWRNHKNTSIDCTNEYYPIFPFRQHSHMLNNVKGVNKIGKISALDKPRVFQINGRWYFAFLDAQITHHMMPNRAFGDSTEEDIPFFWSPDCVPLLIKQGHTIMNWFKSNPAMAHLSKQNLSSNEKEQYDTIVKQLLYPDWNINTWQVKKASNSIAPPEYSWFYQNTQDQGFKNWNRVAVEYSEQVLSIRQKTTTENSQDSIQQRDGWWHLPGCWSKLYALEP